MSGNSDTSNKLCANNVLLACAGLSSSQTGHCLVTQPSQASRQHHMLVLRFIHCDWSAISASSSLSELLALLLNLL